MAAPKQLAIFTASFQDVGLSTEKLHVTWEYPVGNNGQKDFLVGTECFLETGLVITAVPDEQLLSSLSMCAILAGEILPGTAEFMTAIGDAANFQTICGNAKLKVAPALVADPDPETEGEPGTVYDLTFQKVGVTTEKVVRADAWTISSYASRLNVEGATAVPCIPGAVHKQFAFKKSDLGAAGSDNRVAVCDWINARAFWI